MAGGLFLKGAVHWLDIWHTRWHSRRFGGAAHTCLWNKGGHCDWAWLICFRLALCLRGSIWLSSGF